MFDRIFVAFDGSPPSRAACRAALEVAARFESEVTVATVHPPSDEPTDGHLESLVPIDAEGKTISALIEEMQKEAHGRGVRSLTHVSLQGETLPTILQYLKTHPQDLLITGSRGLSRGRRLLQGSISYGLVEGAPCPVLVVRPQHLAGRSFARPKVAH
jgi:nucleotide-binding universal stress UspA family protein